MQESGLVRALYGIAAAGLAVLSLVSGNFEPILEPLSIVVPWAEVWLYGAGTILLAASVGLFYARTALVSVMIIGAYESVWAAVRVHTLLLKPSSIGSWYGVGEALGPLIGAWILYAVLRRQYGSATASAMTGDRALVWARVLFGAACIAYGAAHFAYATYTATMVPAWLPNQTVLTYLTGIGHAAAGLALLVGILPRLAATLEAIMMSLFGVVVWLPSFFARSPPTWAPTSQIRWSETFLTFLLAASAWIVAASLRNIPSGSGSALRGSDPLPSVADTP